ncbi:MAG: hypothetical protein Q9166_003740 [cf. Caloplaca sp. 2 TL-2023]
MAATPGLCTVPTEVLDIITKHLTSEGPSSVREFRQEPSIHLLDNDHRPLKELSLTSRSLRVHVFENLFSYLRAGFRTFRPFTNGGEKPAKYLQCLVRLSKFIRLFHLTGRVRSITMFFPEETRLADPIVENILATVIGGINPNSFTVIGSPSLLCDFNHEHIGGGDEWAFGRKFDVLYLEQPKHLAGPQSTGTHEFRGGLLKSRPWTVMRLNEGSNLPVYSSYEYYLKKTPSIIPSLVGARSRVSSPSLLPSLRHLDYISIFPLPSHVSKLALALRSLPQLVSLATQFLPAEDARENVLEDPAKLGKAAIADIWSETRQSYEDLAWEIGNWAAQTNLRVWTTVDVQLDVDEILRPRLMGWESTEPRVWERIVVRLEEEIHV